MKITQTFTQSFLNNETSDTWFLHLPEGALPLISATHQKSVLLQGKLFLPFVLKVPKYRLTGFPDQQGNRLAHQFWTA